MTTFAERVTATDPLDGQPASTQRTVAFYGCNRVLGTAGSEAAMITKKRAKNQLVEFNHTGEELSHFYCVFPD